MENFSTRLKELRQEKELTLKQLSDDTGISLSAIGHWENSRREIKASSIIILAKYFEVTAGYFLGMED